MRKKEEVLIIAEDEEYWPIHRKGSFLAKNMDKKTAPADYVAVYRCSPLKAIVCYGKVTRIEDNVPYSIAYKGTSIAKRAGFVRVYHVEEFIELDEPILFDRDLDGSPVRSREYCKFEDLLKAKTLADLRK
ncbi:MAG TPA: hypothetical protein PK176_14235 [Acidobacteriota bacterium]|nr:hypothetical protein [Acidobacteriota bacterium]HQM64464.1 hypothetical protein [Acidobacteriota bacterium]